MQNDDLQKSRNHLAAIEAELDHLWMLHGLRPPLRVDNGGDRVVATRDDAGRRVFDRGAKSDGQSEPRPHRAGH